MCVTVDKWQGAAGKRVYACRGDVRVARAGSGARDFGCRTRACVGVTASLASSCSVDLLASLLIAFSAVKSTGRQNRCVCPFFRRGFSFFASKELALSARTRGRGGRAERKRRPRNRSFTLPLGCWLKKKKWKKKMTAVGKSKRQAGTTRSPFKRRLPPGYSSIVAGAARPGRSMFPREASAALFLPLHGLAAAARRRPVCCPPLLLPSGTHVNGTRRRL